MVPIETTSLAKEVPETAVGDGGGIMVIKKGRLETGYSVSELGTPWPGRYFVLQNLRNGLAYNVFIGPINVCDCIGFLKNGYCKHVDVLSAICNPKKG